MSIKTRILYVTPAMAKRWLAKNTANYRSLSARKVATYARDMKSGDWKNNGESIKFYDDGTLFDGQHRLAAIIQANVPVLMMVVWGISKDVTICDSGANRTQLQVLKASEPDKRLHNTQIIALANRIIAKDLDVHKQAPRMMTTKYIDEHRDLLAEMPALIDRGECHPMARNAACYLATYIHLRLGTDSRIISEFFSIVNSGFVDGFVEGSPAIVLRNLLINCRGFKHVGDTFKKIYANALFLLFDFADQKKRRQTYQFNEAAQEYFDKLLKEDGLGD